MTLTPCGRHTDQGLIPLIGCVSLCGGVMPVFFQKWKNAWSQRAWSQHQKTHGVNINYTEPTTQESNLIKLLVPHPLENLYTLSFGSSPQRGLKAWYPVGTFGAAPREKYGFFSESVGKKTTRGIPPSQCITHPIVTHLNGRSRAEGPRRNPSERTFEGRRPEVKLIWTDIRGPKARDETHLNGRLRADGSRWNPSELTFEGRRPEMKHICTDVWGPKARENSTFIRIFAPNKPRDKDGNILIQNVVARGLQFD